jgi:hypothetical protein
MAWKETTMYGTELSSPGEFHPQALTEPCVTVSCHTAPIVQPTNKEDPNERTGLVAAA